MKNEFVLRLKGCSIDDEKRVIEAIRSVNIKCNTNLSKDNNSKFLCVLFGFGFGYTKGNLAKAIKYKMPQDWDKIQEALGIEDRTDVTHIALNTNHVVCPVDYVSRDGYKLKDCDYVFASHGICKPSTKEAYEAQEAKKFRDDYKVPTLSCADVFLLQEEEPKLGTIEYDLKKQSVMINELNAEIESKDKRIAELEGSLIIIGELANKVLL